MGAHAAVASSSQPSSAKRILSTALDLFAVKGYDATSVREICEAADITKTNALSLLREQGRRAPGARDRPDSSSSAASWNRASSAPGSFRDRLKMIARLVFEDARTQPRLWRFIHGVIWAPPGTTDPPACTEFYDGVVGSLATAAEQAVCAR